MHMDNYFYEAKRGYTNQVKEGEGRPPCDSHIADIVSPASICSEVMVTDGLKGNATKTINRLQIFVLHHHAEGKYS